MRDLIGDLCIAAIFAVCLGGSDRLCRESDGVVVMAKYRQLMTDDGYWHLMSPSNPIEALRIAWMLWRYPNRVAALVGVSEEYRRAHWKPIGVAEAGRRAFQALDRDRAAAQRESEMPK